MTTPRFEPIAVALLAEGRSIRFRADGWSMMPTIRPGDTLVIEPVSGEEISVGTIVFFLLKERPLVHRVIAISGEGEERRFTMRGDGSERRDRPVAAGAILGRLLSAERNGVNVPLEPESGPRMLARRAMNVLRRGRARVPK